MAFTDTLQWPECNSDKATVGSVVCTVYTGGQPYKPCVLCETGLTCHELRIIRIPHDKFCHADRAIGPVFFFFFF